MDTIEEALEKSNRKSRNQMINFESFNKAMDTLGVIMSSYELHYVYTIIQEKKGANESDNDAADDNCIEDNNKRKSVRTSANTNIDLEDIISFIKNFDSKASSSIKNDKIKSGGLYLLSPSIVDDLKQSAITYLKASEESLYTALNQFGVNNQESNNRSNTSSITYLSEKQLKKAMEKIGCQDTSSSTVNLIYSCFHMNEEVQSFNIFDLHFYLFTLLNENDDSVNIGNIIKDIYDKKKALSYKDVMKAMSSHDKKSNGYITGKEFEKTLLKLSGNRNTELTSTDISDMMNFLDGIGHDMGVDYAVVAALVFFISNIDYCILKLKNFFKIMKIRSVDYQTFLYDMFEGSKSVISESDMMAGLKALNLPISDFELHLIISKFSKRGKISVQSFLEKIEDDSKGSSGINKAKSKITKWLGHKNAANTSYDFGKELYTKICKIRTNKKNLNKLRVELITNTDPDLNGRISGKELKEIIEKYGEFTDAEINLLIENMAFTDGNFKNDIDYSLLLLILYEPYEKCNEIVQAGQEIMKKLLQGSDSVSLRRLLALLFRNFAASDPRASGMIPLKDARIVVQEEGSTVSRKLIDVTLRAFQDDQSDCIYYPEYLSFLSCCSLWSVMYRLHFVDKIRKKQGYKFNDFLVKYTAKNGKKIDRGKALELLISIGMILPESALETVFNQFSNDTKEYLDTTGFVNGLANIDSDEGGKPTASRNWDNNGITFDGKCSIKDELLQEYDKKMIDAVKKAFDLFDGTGSNTLSCVDLDRVLCALNQTFDEKDILSLLGKIDPNNTGLMHYTEFMDYVVKFIQSRYNTIHKVSIMRVRESFKRFDMNGDGTISFAELKFIMSNSSKSLTLTSGECEALIEALDTDRNGNIEYIEFADLFELVKDDVKMLDLPVTLRQALRKVFICFVTVYII